MPGLPLVEGEPLDLGPVEAVVLAWCPAVEPVLADVLGDGDLVHAENLGRLGAADTQDRPLARLSVGREALHPRQRAAGRTGPLAGMWMTL